MPICGLYPAGDYAGLDQAFSMALVVLKDEPDLVEAILLTVKEQLSNIREHQYQLDMTRQIWLDIAITWQQVTIVLIDVGPRWIDDGYYYCPDAEEQMQKLAEELAPRGRGHLIMAMLTHLSGKGSLHYGNGGRVRTMRWLRNGRK